MSWSPDSIASTCQARSSRRLRESPPLPPQPTAAAAYRSTVQDARRQRLADGALGGPDTRPDMASVEISGPHVRCSLAVADALSAGNLKMVAAPSAE